jgi:hypothetical protein
MYPITRTKFSPYLLDNISSNPVSAYALRRLTVKYTGPLVRVRRSSDNAEEDIKFTNQGLLDTAQLTAFIGANNGLVTTWYDQSPSRFPVTQATAAFQPTLVSSGTVNTINGKPTVAFLKSSTQYLDNTSAVSVLSSMAVASYTTATYAGYAGLVTDTNAIIYGLLGEDLTTQLYVLTGNHHVNGVNTNTTPMNNTLFVATERSTGANRAWTGVNIGKQSIYNFRTWDGNISEVINLSSFSLGARRQIELNQGKYYGVTV